MLLKALLVQGMGGFQLKDVMSTEITSVAPDMKLADLSPLFQEHTGLPVLDEEKRLVGVISRRDMERGGVRGDHVQTKNVGMG